MMTLPVPNMPLADLQDKPPSAAQKSALAQLAAAIGEEIKQQVDVAMHR